MNHNKSIIPMLFNNGTLHTHSLHKSLSNRIRSEWANLATNFHSFAARSNQAYSRRNNSIIHNNTYTKSKIVSKSITPVLPITASLTCTKSRFSSNSMFDDPNKSVPRPPKPTPKQPRSATSESSTSSTPSSPNAIDSSVANDNSVEKLSKYNPKHYSNPEEVIAARSKPPPSPEIPIVKSIPDDDPNALYFTDAKDSTTRLKYTKVSNERMYTELIIVTAIISLIAIYIDYFLPVPSEIKDKHDNTSDNKNPNKELIARFERQAKAELQQSNNDGKSYWEKIVQEFKGELPPVSDIAPPQQQFQPFWKLFVEKDNNNNEISKNNLNSSHNSTNDRK